MKTLGFTLVELLVVISILAILSGITFGVVNIPATRRKAEDGLRQSNFSKLVYAIESFEASEGRYPLHNTENNRADEATFGRYLSAWPIEPEGTNYIYWSNNDNRNTDFGLVVALSSGTEFLKFKPGYAVIMTCTNGDPSLVTCN